MGNTIQYLKDPALVRRIQEAFGVRQVSVEVQDASSKPSERVQDSSSSAEDSADENNYTKTQDKAKVTADSSKALSDGSIRGVESLSWLSSKTRVRRCVCTPPPLHQTPPSTSSSTQAPPTSTSSSTTATDHPEVLVVETIPIFDIYFRLATELGYEPFYITSVPFVYWNIDTVIARHIVLVWCLSMYVGQSAKQIFKLKRPASPPSIRLEDNPSLDTEYGFPSTHATVGTSFPLCILYGIMGRYEVRLTSIA